MKKILIHHYCLLAIYYIFLTLPIPMIYTHADTLTS